MPYKKGECGNPKGRPKGVLNQARLREVIAKDLPDILKQLAQLAKAGDVQAAALLLNRTLPVLKATDQPAPVLIGTDLTRASANILAGLESGDLTPDQGASMAAVLAALARVKETTELESRIAALETHHERA